MKYATAVIAIAVMAIFPLNAFAGCPTINGPYSCCGNFYYTYVFDTSCAGTSGNVSATTMYCDFYNSTPAKQFGTGSSSATYSFIVGASDPIVDSNNWEVDLRYVEWSDPNASMYNTLSATLSVTHNGSTTSNTFYSINGTTSQNCALSSYASFSAVAGDTITVTVNTTIYNSNVTAQVAAPILFNSARI
jgi:hypothetical protein